MDHETNPSFTLNVEVDDEGGNGPDSATMTINVDDVNEAPTVSGGSFSVSEDATNGTVVGTVTGTDPEGLSVSYSIVGSTPFAIGSSSGQITVANTSQLDHETNPVVTISVKASDPANNFNTADVEITVTDVNDPPTSSGIPDVVVNEGSPPTVIHLRDYFSDDEDADAALDFVVQGNSNPSLFSSVEINDSNDYLTLTYVNNASGIANITIRATDTGGKYVDDTFKVDINDAPTTSGIGDFSVNEDASNTTINLYNVFDDAEDADSALTYEVVSNSNGGLVSTSIVKPNLILNYAKDAFGKATIVVKATDTQGLSVQTEFEVTVNAVNDNPTTNGLDDIQVEEDVCRIRR
ncbi:MAG: cadherin domain-containing protein [Chloroflexota bacterium]